MEVSYDVIRRKFPDVFCVDNIRRIYKQNSDELSMSFVDFLFYTEDYYLLKYAGKLSKTAWWLFSLLKVLVRYNGFVKLSHKDVLSYFRIEGKEAISKPTFFKYIDELESFGIVRRYNNKRLFNTQYQNDSNTYVVISCVDEVLEICKRVTDRTSFRELVLGSYVEPQVKKKKRKSDEKSDSDWYKEISAYYADIWPVFESFFEFLGKKNKTGRISLSRKVKIARFCYERDDCDENVTYAFYQQMKRNINNEKYAYAILKGMEGEVAPPIESDGHSSPVEMGMTKAEYEFHRNALLDGSNLDYYRELLNLLSGRDKFNEYEQRLYDAATVISRKMEVHEDNFGRSDKRMDLLEDDYGIIERFTYDRKFNKIVTWFYRDDSVVPLAVMRDIKQKHRQLFDFYKYEIPDGRYYNGL